MEEGVWWGMIVVAVSPWAEFCPDRTDAGFGLTSSACAKINAPQA